MWNACDPHVRHRSNRCCVSARCVAAIKHGEKHMPLTRLSDSRGLTAMHCQPRRAAVYPTSKPGATENCLEQPRIVGWGGELDNSLYNSHFSARILPGGGQSAHLFRAKFHGYSCAASPTPLL